MEIVSNLRDFVISFEGITALLSFIYLKNYTNKFLKYLPYFLLLVFINEGLSISGLVGPNKSLQYNIIALIGFNYYITLYRNTFKKAKSKQLAYIGQLLLNACYLMEFAVIGIQNKTSLYSYTLGGFVIILLTSMYFIQKLELKGKLLIKGDVMFWISTGLLLFYVGYIPIKLGRIYYSDVIDSYQGILILQFILILLMNVCFILGFKWARKNS